jgi:hypothetical protein
VTLEQLAYETSAQSLRKQESTLTELRARTGTLLTAASLVASFLGGRAIDLEGLSALNVVAGLAYLATIAISVYVLAPTAGLEFAIRGSEAYEYFVRGGINLDDAHRTLAYWIDERHATNKRRIDHRVLLFSAACLAFVPEVVFWSLSLALH